MSTPVLFIDVDDTLIRTVGPKRIPMTSSVELIRELHRKNARLFCWSTGGGEYARAAAVELGIESCFEAFLPKPHVLIDDVELRNWRVRQFHPNEATSMTADELLAKAQRPGTDG